MSHPLLNQGPIEQEVRTPPNIIARVVRAFGGPVELDPCAPTRSEPSFFARRYVREAENGLLIPWIDKTYVNPPFDDLETWLRKMREEASRGHRLVGLVPWRSHRDWFLEALETNPRPTVTFEPGVRFVGFKGIFPAPIALLAWHCVVPGRVVVEYRTEPRVGGWRNPWRPRVLDHRSGVRLGTLGVVHGGT